MQRIPITVSAACALACAARPAQDIQPPSLPVQPAAEAAPAAPTATAWPPRADSLLTRTENRLVWRAFGASGLAAFAHVIASDVLELLYDAELELLWFSDEGGRLWVSDLRALAASTPSSAPSNVLIASDVPEHQNGLASKRARYLGLNS